MNVYEMILSVPDLSAMAFRVGLSDENVSVRSDLMSPFSLTAKWTHDDVTDQDGAGYTLSKSDEFYVLTIDLSFMESSEVDIILEVPGGSPNGFVRHLKGSKGKTHSVYVYIYMER